MRFAILDEAARQHPSSAEKGNLANIQIRLLRSAEEFLIGPNQGSCTTVEIC